MKIQGGHGPPDPDADTHAYTAPALPSLSEGIKLNQTFKLKFYWKTF